VLALILANAAWAAARCAPAPSPVVPNATVTHVDIAAPSAFVLLGAGEQLTATATLSNGATQSASGTWLSDAPAVASVSAGGVLTGVSPGLANITFEGSAERVSVRVVPNYGGTWTGTAKLTTCRDIGADQTVRDAAAGYCIAFEHASLPSLSFKMSLLQEGDRVSGSAEQLPVTGVIAVDGTLTLANSSTWEIGITFNRVITWTLSSQHAGDLSGSLNEVMTPAGAHVGTIQRAETILTAQSAP
jgi:hypothetical protein